jgi:hypothetical protein
VERREKQEPATAHLKFFKGREYRQEYVDAVRKSPAKFRRWRAGLEQHRRVVVTRDDWHEDRSCTRTGFSDVWDIEDLVIGEDWCTFRWVKRYVRTQA